MQSKELSRILFSPSVRKHQFFVTQPSEQSNSYICTLLLFSLSPVQLFVTPWTAAHQASLFITNLEFAQTHVHLISDAIQSSHPVLPFLLLPSIFLSIRVFSNESTLHMGWPEYWSFSFNTSPSNEYSTLVSFKIHWFDLFAVQGILKSLLQHHSLKASILRH